MPTVSRWWSSRSAPQRIDLYTRWSFYSYLGAGLPLFALAVTGSAMDTEPVAAVRLFLLGSVVTAVAAVVLSARGLDAHRTGRRIPRTVPGLAVAAGLLTGAAGAWAFTGGVDGAPEVAWAVGLPLGMVLTAGTAVWTSRQLLAPSLSVGVLAGLAAAVGGGPVQAVVLGVLVGGTVYAVVLAFRFTVWVLDVVLEMERSRGVQLQLAVAEERLRFARDLHDVMGRNLSAIAVKSQLAGELVRRSRPGAAEEVADVHRIAEESLREMREVVRGYRSTDLTSELAGARSVLRAAGIRCTVQGEDGAAALPEAVQAALGWVVREAVTNVLRHSQAAACTIELQATAGGARLTVRNDGVTGPPGRGSGLTGLRERLTGAGGALETAREADRFTVTATLPTGRTA